MNRRNFLASAGAALAAGPALAQAPKVFLDYVRHLERIVAPVTVVYGTLETPEFQRQSREFAEALRKAGKPVQLVVADGYNHFELMETLANPFQFAGRAALDQMKLKAPL